MAKMSFPNPVKYNGVNYKARETFEVKASDVAELKKKGGWLIQESESEAEKPAKKAPAKSKSKEVKEEDKAE